MAKLQIGQSMLAGKLGQFGQLMPGRLALFFRPLRPGFVIPYRPSQRAETTMQAPTADRQPTFQHTNRSSQDRMGMHAHCTNSGGLELDADIAYLYAMLHWI